MTVDLRATPDARRDDESARAFARAAAAARAAALEAGRALLRLERCGHHLAEGCASIGEYGERHGVAAVDARHWVALARAVEHWPSLAVAVEAGEISVRAAAILGAVLEDSRLLRTTDDWIGWAGSESAHALRRRLERRREEVRTGGAPVVGVTVFVPEPVRDDFGRARTIASRKAQRSLSDGEAFATVVEHYLDSFDPDRRRPGVRRLPPTGGLRGRYVPTEVRRALRDRDGDRCAFPYCDHRVFLQDAHVRPHAGGGDREAANLVRLCTRHHAMLDQGRLRVTGPAAAPTFTDAEGRPIDRRTGPPRARPRRRPADPSGPGPPSG